ncbi:hypothetical protein [Bradyrhizobium sp. CSA207]|uniref:hypothetical protein n=1 Tax=Bradyrhizobium sp. CSA207 TaxID=2698826 RepID=UPI0031837756
MQTSRAQLDRLLDPNNESVTLATLTRRAGRGPPSEDGIGLGPPFAWSGATISLDMAISTFAESVYLSENSANAQSRELRSSLRFVPYPRSTYRTINLVRPSYRRVSRVTGIDLFLQEAHAPRSANHCQAGVQTGGREKLSFFDHVEDMQHAANLDTDLDSKLPHIARSREYGVTAVGGKRQRIGIVNRKARTFTLTPGIPLPMATAILFMPASIAASDSGRPVTGSGRYRLTNAAYRARID